MTVAQGALTFPNSNPLSSHIPYCPNLLFQCHWMLDTTVNHVSNMITPTPNELTALSATITPSLPTIFSIYPDQMEKILKATPFSTPGSTATGNSVDECMWQQECCFLAHLAKLQQTLRKIACLCNKQTFITQCNAMPKFQLLHPLWLASPTKPFILQKFDHNLLEL